MVRNFINYFVDAVMFLLIAINAISILSHDRYVHEISGYLFFAAIIIHIILHWRWIISTTKELFTK